MAQIPAVMPSLAPVKNPLHGLEPSLLSTLQHLQFKARKLMEGFLSGLHRSPFHGYSMEFFDYRTYQPGDDLRHLDWRLYARSDRLCLKRYRHETNVRFYMLCDASASMRYRGQSATGTKFEVARTLAAALGWFLLRQNDAPGFIGLQSSDATPQYLPPSQKPAQMGLLLRGLAELEPAGGPCLSRLLWHTARLAHRRSVLLLFSDLLEPAKELIEHLKHLRALQHELIVFQILDPEELEFPFAQSAVFEDLESGVRRTVQPEGVRSEYLKQLHLFLEQYRRLFAELEVSHTIIRTDAEPVGALAFFLSSRRLV
jgi:uncharacterized protein (DUF58 family)